MTNRQIGGWTKWREWGASWGKKPCKYAYVIYGWSLRKVLPDLSNPSEESYVAVSGRPGERTVHIVNGRGGDFAGQGTAPAKFEKHLL